jgi:iron complex transport system substrate-binding protein
MSFIAYILFHCRNSLLKSAFLILTLVCSCKGNVQNVSVQSGGSDNELVKRATRFKLMKLNGSVLLTIIDPWQGAENVNFTYHLVNRGTALPAGLDSSDVIFVPLKKIICMSTTHVAMISALNEEATIKGVSGAGFIFSPSLSKNIERGLVEDVGYEANLNKELILEIAPDVIMMYGIGSESAGYVGKIKELGVKVMFNADYLESDPLSKAEWIKLFGALYCKELKADSLYNSQCKLYDSLRSYIGKNLNFRPKVMLGLPYKDTWYISPGNSFASRLITDAGGDYLWHDTESPVSLPFGIESVYLKALTADYWLNIGAVKTKNEISAIDTRLNELPAFRKGKLYNNNNRISSKGGNDYWESGSINPYLILKDIASILHPELLENHQLFYYRKID